jgi:phenylacetate-CoA ligase|tara:strand:- start:105 stop:1463 length:1359 start_codon:yes stop_codon:yes gene_type:complete
MIRSLLFLASHELFDTRFYSLYRKYCDNQWLDYDELKAKQENQLKKIIAYAYNKVPYYKKIFDDRGIYPRSIQTVEDLERLPILSKNHIKNNWDVLKPKCLNSIHYYKESTGGTTGTPFEYRLDRYNRLLGLVLLYRGWSMAGYRLSDKTVFLGGASIDIGKSNFIQTRIHELGRHVKKLSSFDMSPREMIRFTKIINSFKPKFIRGYASSIFFFSQWIAKEKIPIYHPKAVITTSDKLYDYMRSEIQNTLQCQVFDTYGLNDGGLGAYECSEHKGMHIDTERSILEVVDDENKKISKGTGRVIATSLFNYSMPFIRYETGDFAEASEKRCNCGRGSNILNEITGRSVDIFVTPEGKYVHGWFFLYIFWEYSKGIKEYQVSQVSENKIIIKIVPERNFDYSEIPKIKEIIMDKSKNWNVEFVYQKSINRTESGKFKFISNDYLANQNKAFID